MGFSFEYSGLLFTSSASPACAYFSIIIALEEKYDQENW